VFLRTIKKGILLFVMLSLVGFTIVKEEIMDDKGSEPEEFSSVNLKDDSLQMERKSIIQFLDKGKMTASWYGPRFHGRLTANGEIYDQMAFTAAHKTMPFGTLLKLTNPKTQKIVIVRINDRGPYILGRELDLSKGAAVALGMLKRGVQKLKVEEVTIADENRPFLAYN